MPTPTKTLMAFCVDSRKFDVPIALGTLTSFVPEFEVGGGSKGAVSETDASPLKVVKSEVVDSRLWSANAGGI